MKTKKKRSKPAKAPQPSLLKQLAQVPEKLFSGSFRQQYGALCFRYSEAEKRVEVLVITSRDSARWVIPKGWPMKRKKPHEAAAIEAWEEAGVRGIVGHKPVGHYTYLKTLDDGKVSPCIVDVYPVRVSEVSGAFKERGERILAWVDPIEAARRVREVELKSLLAEFHPDRIR